MITVSFVFHKYERRPSGTSGHLASTVSQKSDHSVKVDKETMDFFMHYGTAFINALHDTLELYLGEMEHVFLSTAEEQLMFQEEYLRFRNVLLKDYLVAFQTLKNISTLPINEAKKLINEKITVIEEIPLQPDPERVKREYESRYPEAKISIKKGTNHKNEDVLLVKRVYENKNLLLHVQKLRDVYKRVLQLTVTYQNRQKAMEKLFQKMEQFESIDFVSLFSSVMEIRERLNRIENMLLEQAIEQEQRKENAELEMLHNQIIRRTEQITEAVYGEKETVQSIEDAEAVTKNARSFLDMVKDTAIEFKNRIMNTARRIVNSIKKTFKRDQWRGPSR